jgi:hypothetical protein
MNDSDKEDNNIDFKNNEAAVVAASIFVIKEHNSVNNQSN